MFINHLTVKQLRCFAETSFEFVRPDVPNGQLSSNITLLLGNNGTGKTSVLRAVALAILGPAIQDSGFVPYRLIRRPAAGRSASVAEVTARLTLHWQDLTDKKKDNKKELTTAASTRTRIERRGDGERIQTDEVDLAKWGALFESRSPAFFVVGYGATRRVEQGATFDASLRSKSRTVRYERVAGLFEDGVTLTPLPSWLPHLQSTNRGRFTQIVRLFNKLLPEDCRLTDKLMEGEYEFVFRDTPVPFPALSDGYKAYIAWIGDLLYHITTGAPNNTKLDAFSGVVLVDEIDLHLHPDWQRVVVPTLSAHLPNLQFILTTHSPIVAGTLESTNIIVLAPGPSGDVVATPGEEPILGRNADQILVSSYFGLDTTRAPSAVSQLRELSKRAQTEPAAALEVLEKLASGFERPKRRAASSRRR